MMRFIALTDVDVRGLACAQCQDAVVGVRFTSTMNRVGACGLAVQGAESDYLIFVVLAGVRPRVRIVCWHQERHDRALLDAVLEHAPRWSVIEARGGYGSHACRTVPAQRLQHWGFLPLGPAPDAWWRLDVGPTVRLRRWVRQQWDGLSMPRAPLADPVTPRNGSASP